ncbi:MAG: right-handed parallel beta-helix repeat-containing protein, partial [Sphingobacterium paramultivorum]
GNYLRWDDTLTGYGAIAVKTGHEIGGIDKPAGVHHNITIQANTINDCANSAIFVSSTDGIKITKNRIYNCSNRSSIPYYGNYAIYLKNCVNEQVFNNSFNQVKKLLGKD